MQFLAQTGGEFLHTLRGAASLTAHAERHADDDFADVLFLHDTRNGTLGLVIRIDRLEGTRDDLGLVTEGETDAHGAVINGEDARHER